MTSIYTPPNHGPWQADDGNVISDGIVSPGLAVADPTVDGLTPDGDTVNVYENANKIGTGPVLSGVKYR